MKPSGIRLGTPALTTRGMKEAEMIQVAEWISRVADDMENPANLAAIKKEVETFAAKFPVPGIN